MNQFPQTYSMSFQEERKPFSKSVILESLISVEIYIHKQKFFIGFQLTLQDWKLHRNFTNPYICCGSIFILGLNFLFFCFGVW